MEFSQDILAIRPDADVELLSRAYDVAARCHQDQKRYSGDPYITHPAAVGSADSRVVAIKLADRLHNMRTLQFLPQEKQLRKAREVLDIFLPAAHQLSLHAIGSELEALAFATLIRNRPAGPPRYRVIAGLDIERSTSRPDPVKAEFRIMLYELFEAALRSADIGPDRRGPFMDRGDGLLVLIDPAERASLLSRVVPVFAQLLAGYNAGLPRSAASGSAPSCTRETSVTTTTAASARPWTSPAACSMPPRPRPPSGQPRTPSSS